MIIRKSGALLLAVLAAAFFRGGGAQAEGFKIGEVDLSVDTTVSAGVGVRTSGQSCNKISAGNGGCPSSNGAFHAPNEDDGNVNVGRWDPYSTVAKITSDVEAKYQNFGAFMRFNAFYDYWGMNKIGQDSTDYGRRPLVDGYRGHDARNFAGRGVKVLDAFVYTNFDVGSSPVSLRVGKQVVNWGESLFIQGGISSYLPFDVSAVRTPGAELKEAYRPEPSVYLSVGLPANFSVEAFYTFGWERTKLDACGTYFSGSDAVCEGGRYVVFKGEYPNSAALIPRYADQEPGDQGQFGLALKYYADWLGNGTDLGAYFVRYHSKLPIGTFTAATSANGGPAYIYGLGNAADGTPIGIPIGNNSTGTAYGFCNMPAFNGGAYNADTITPDGFVDFAECNQNVIGGVVSPFAEAILNAANSKHSVVTYPKDIQEIGASFNTTVDLLGGTALSGELLFTRDMPFQISDVEVNANDIHNTASGYYIACSTAGICNAPGLGNLTAAQVAALTGPYAGLAAANDTIRANGTYVAPGGIIRGYDEYNTWTGQLGTISTLTGSSPVVSAIGSDVMFLVGNVGFQYIRGLNDNNRLAIPHAADGNPNPIVAQILGNDCVGLGTCPIPPQAKYASSFSWGYRLALSTDYNNALGTSWTVSPFVQFGHDVSGYSAGPIGPGFIEGRKTVSLGINAKLRDIRAALQYTNSFGNYYRNAMADKDFATATISYSF
ncbi:MAG: DUF1302 domain-containing protein [Parvibaculum sp.]|uniref:DUF1302 domain-containing protein n=1 Tax=Parvibaculum sp. TaxID=2024848 RepID=UPI003C70F669